MRRLRRPGLLVLCALIAAAFALRTSTLEAQSLWRDEVDALCYAFEFPRLLAPETPGAAELPFACPSLSPTSADELDNPARLAHVLRVAIQHNGPLYYFLLRGWVALAGYSVYALRFFSLLPGVLVVPLTYVLARRIVGSQQASRPAGTWAAVCAAFSPYFAWYSDEVKMYALLLALACLAVYALYRALDGQAGWWVSMVIATSLGVYLHILAALLIPLQLVLLLSRLPGSRRTWLQALAAFACLSLPYLPLLVWQLPLALKPAQTGYPFYSLAEMITMLLYGFASGVVGHSLGWVLFTPLLVLGVSGVLFGPLPLRQRLGLLAWFAGPILALHLVSLQRPIFTDRYLIWIGPAVYVLVALGTQAIRRASLLVAVLVLLPLWAAFGRGLLLQATTPIKSDFRAAASYVEQHAGPNDLFAFQIPHVRYTFDYYYPYPFEWLDGLYTNYGMSDEEVDAGLLASIGQHAVVWLIASEMTMWDQKLQVLGWFDAHAHRTDAAHFVLVDVYRYELPPD